MRAGLAVLAVLAAIAATAAADEELKTRVVRRRIGGEQVTLTEVKAHYGTVAVAAEHGEYAEELARALFGWSGAVDRLLREWEEAETRFAERYRKAMKAASGKEERAASSRYRMSFLDSKISREISRRRQKQEKYALSSRTVKPLTIELFADEGKVRSIMERRGGQNLFGDYFPSEARAVVTLGPSKLVNTTRAAYLCLQHVFDKYLDNRSRRAYSQQSNDRKSYQKLYYWRNHWLAHGLLNFYAFRVKDPGLAIPLCYLDYSAEMPPIEVFFSQDPAQPLIEHNAYFVSAALGYIHEKDPVGFFRLLTAVIGRLGAERCDVRLDGVIEILDIGEGRTWSSWHNLVDRYEEWKKARLATDRKSADALYAEWRRAWGR